MESPELKPCPFCGGDAYRAMGCHADESPWPYVECAGCAATADSSEIWNTRAELTSAQIADVRAQVIAEAADRIAGYAYSLQSRSKLRRSQGDEGVAELLGFAASVIADEVVIAIRALSSVHQQPRRGELDMEVG